MESEYIALLTATPTELEVEGIDDDLTNKEVKVIKEYRTGYAQIVGTPHSYHDKRQLWDIPLLYLTKV